MMNNSAEIKLFERYQQSLAVNGTLLYVGHLLARAAVLFPDSTALIFHNESISYKALYARARAVSVQLQQLGVRPRDRVCILIENSIDFYCIYFGVWQIGAVVVPLNTFLHERELKLIIEDAKPSFLISTPQFLTQLSALQLSVTVLNAHDLYVQTTTDYTPQFLDADEMSALLYTSGTTGVPKGVMLSSRNILTNIMQGMVRIEAGPQDRALAVLPLFHSFAQLACVWGAVFVGCAVIIVPKIDRKAIMEGLTHKPTFVLGVPALYGLFCLMRTINFDSVRYFVSGGDALPDKIRIFFELIYRRRLCNGYGLTEASPLICVNFDDEIVQPNTVGKPVVGLHCSIRDEQGNELNNGTPGVLWVKGANIMLGYYNAPEQTKAVLKDGWLDTGDYAFFDDYGRIVISGRQKDLIIHKGFNIYPQEIENVLFMHPQVTQVAVIGKKDAEVGEIPVAFVVLKEPITHAETVLKKFCAHHLAAYKIPRQFIIVAELPLTSLRKVDKKKLRKEYFEK